MSSARRTSILAIVSIVVVTLALHGSTNLSDPETWCSTGPDQEQQSERLTRWSRARQAAARTRDHVAVHGSSPSRFENGVFIVPSDDSIAPFDHAADLADSSLYFTRTSTTSFTVQKTSLVYDDDPGTLRRTFNFGFASEPYTIASFSFPFYGSTATSLHIGSNKGIYFSTPGATAWQQHGPLEALSQRIPLIAPLLETTQEVDGRYFLYAKETPTALTLTWRSRFTAISDEDIQVVLFNSGDIRFSYKKLVNRTWGAVIVTSGAEAFHGTLNVQDAAIDPTGDVNPTSVPAPFTGMVDIESVEVRRVSNSDLIEFAMTFQTAPDPSLLSGSQNFWIRLAPGGSSAERLANQLDVQLFNGSTRYFPAAWSSATNSPAISLSGRTVTIRIMDEQLTFASMPIALETTVFYNNGFADLLDIAPMTLGAPSVSAATDLSTLTSATPITGKPIVEAFTLPILSPEAVWDRLKADFSLTDAEIDQIPIYPNFPTDIRFYASGYSIGGVPAVAGISTTGSSSSAKKPSLLHMGQLTSTPNLFLLLHEFGHRWLYFIRIREGGVDTTSLNSGDRVHPNMGVHNPAAFPITSATDSSPMGGGYFTQTGPTTYATPPVSTPGPYSWHELYLMGLASAADVSDPWFYLAGTGLMGPYWPAQNTTYTVTSRTNVIVQQIIDALGPRDPGFATSLKSFKTLFTIVEKPGSPVSEAAIDEFTSEVRGGFQSHFATMTGSRGAIITTPDAILPQADFTWSPAGPTAGDTVTFTDASHGDPTTWMWDFGDGGVSTQQNLTHAFPWGGTFNVSLTAGKPSGSHTITKSVFVNTCSIDRTPAGTTAAAEGGEHSTSITAASQCSWSATSNESWITILSGENGFGDGTLTVNVEPNPGCAQRTGTVTFAVPFATGAGSGGVNYVDFTVTQTGSPTAVTLSETSAVVAASGDSGSVTVSADPDCHWTASTLAEWITITGGTPGSGPGTVSYTIASNSGSARTGIITIGNRQFTVNQHAAGINAPVVTASRTSASQVTVSWGGVTNASTYEVYRKSGAAAPAFMTSTAATSYTNSGLAGNTTYIYSVYAITAGAIQSLPGIDWATTMTFLDDPLQGGTTTIRAQQVEEARTAVNRARTAAGLPLYVFTNPSLSGTTVRALHMQELRTALAEARGAAALPPLSHIHVASPGTLVRAIDLEEIRNGSQ